MPLNETSCVLCGLCISTCPTGAMYERAALGRGQIKDLEKVRTVCPYCGVGCTMELNVNRQTNQIVRVTAAVGSVPNDGNLCVKGKFGFEYVHSPERLTTPLIKENGRFREASWDGIPEAQRGAVVDGLSRVLADSYTLYLKTHSYHWNVVGPMFHSLHAMFMDQYTELALAVDEIAERIRALGAPAPGTYRQFGALATVTEDTDVPDAIEMIRRLVAGHEATARTIRGVLTVAEAPRIRCPPTC